MRLAEISLSLAVLAGLLASLVLLVIIPPVTDFSSCREINSSGTYNVTADITGASIAASPLVGKACIKIVSPNVILECNGYSITEGGAGGTTYGVLLSSPATNVTIRNCPDISGYTQGIYVYQSDGNNFTNTSAIGNDKDGFHIDESDDNLFELVKSFGNSQHGISLDESSSNNLTDVESYDNDKNGVYLKKSDSNNFTLVNLTGNSQHGAGLDQSDNNTFTGVFSHDNNYGFYVIASENNRFINNTVNDSFLNGFYLDGADSSSFVDNTVHLNTDGFLIRRCFSSNFTGNIVYGNDNAFILENSSDSNLINNTAYSNMEATYLLNSNATITGDHYYDNTYGLSVEGTGMTISLAGVVFDNPAGNLTNYTNLSLDDAVASAYGINYATSPAPLPPGSQSFRGTFIEIINKTTNVSLDSIVWHWQENETANYTEGWFKVWKYNGTWSNTGASLDTSANTLTLTGLDSFSTFAILETEPPPGGDDGDSEEARRLSVSFSSTCDGNLVTVEYKGEPVDGATVVVSDAAMFEVYTTDSNGHVEFPGCDAIVRIHANKDGYVPDSVTRSLVNCAACVPASCASDDDCLDGQYCAAGQCFAVECPCGVVEDHGCIPYECCTDGDCPPGQVCIDNECQAERPVCESDADCADNEYCEEGTCESVEGVCGYAEDHAWIGYECGDAQGCPACPAGSVCIDNSCVPGEPVTTISVNASAEAQLPEEEPPSVEPFTFLGLLVVLVVLGLLAFYLIGKKGGKKGYSYRR